MIPFAQRCLQTRPGTLVQEDNASSHAHRFLKRVYSIAKILRLLWPGNSPDLNAIEKAWPWLKKKTSWNGLPPTLAALKTSWDQAWEALPHVRVWTRVLQLTSLPGNKEDKSEEEQEKYTLIPPLYRTSWLRFQFRKG